MVLCHNSTSPQSGLKSAQPDAFTLSSPYKEKNILPAILNNIQIRPFSFDPLFFSPFVFCLWILLPGVNSPNPHKSGLGPLGERLQLSPRSLEPWLPWATAGAAANVHVRRCHVPCVLCCCACACLSVKRSESFPCDSPSRSVACNRS